MIFWIIDKTSNSVNEVSNISIFKNFNAVWELSWLELSGR